MENNDIHRTNKINFISSVILGFPMSLLNVAYITSPSEKDVVLFGLIGGCHPKEARRPVLMMIGLARIKIKERHVIVCICNGNHAVIHAPSLMRKDLPHGTLFVPDFSSNPKFTRLGQARYE
eukprot:Blabericola_migrator_1__7817@NODE_39_length_17554_cov_37_506147_g35_i0_p13_GENE_NODE_39_length_17554_cov_37_506147_g35_i0NODE_39_length_17554_cov_37_506147_g35_i0_p13_ORF_typecomplete_len122_score7_88_NODE_39_length_17554_cov_37_506147_g35_i081446